MGPIAKKAATDNAGKSIQFVTFDFTSDKTKAEAEAAAKKHGVQELYASNAPKTGFLLLYDTASKKVVARLSASDDQKAWQAAIDKGLGS